MPASTVSSSRRLALRHLERVARSDAYVGRLDLDALDDFDAGSDPGRTRRQAKERVAGVTRWRRWLDFLLAAFYNGDYDQMEDRLRQILRLGAYELLYLQTPTHAAVDEHVELAKQTVRPGAAGLVNGILRTLDRQRDDLPAPDTGDRADDLAVRHSHPTWIVRRWLDRYGEATAEELLQWDNRRPVYGVRAHPERGGIAALQDWLDVHDVTWTASPYLDDFVRVRRLQKLVQEGLLEDGDCAVQDESAGLVVRLLDPQPGDTVLDICAAPGGKTAYAAARMQGTGTLYAADVHADRLALVQDAAAAQGWTGMLQTEAADLRDLAGRSDPPQGDRVLLDVPCSGFGVLAKRADLRWQRAPDDLAELTTLQDELLDAAARLVRPGGVLVYSTCTIEPEENEERVAAFLDRHDDFTLEPAGSTVPEKTVTEEGYYATRPDRHAVDGAFGARLRRAG
jgi:16S rRNA (cytosine967-C5)-methyltransferase